jgi:hypothetical protein
MTSAFALSLVYEVVIVLLSLPRLSEVLTSRGRNVVAVVGGAGSLWLAIPVLRSVASNLRTPREWDFWCFWLWGRMGASRVNFYDPKEALAVASSIDLSDEFSRAILNVGFWYPPPTMLLFAPLGFLPIRTALWVWYALQGAFAVGGAWLLYKTFAREQGFLGMVAVLAMMVILPPARSTVWFAQTNFMLLVFYMLLYRDRDTPRAGLWVALGAMVKPYFVFFLAFLLFKRAYKAMAIAAAAGLGALGLSAIAFGIAPLATFWTSNPGLRVPGYIYGEPINQSLLGTILRFTGGIPDGSPIGHPLYVGLAAVLVMTSAWAVHRARQVNSGHALHVNLLLALLLYPGTLAHYSVLLLAPLLALWSARAAFPFGARGVIATVVVVYAMLGWDRFESYNFWANLTMWGVSVFLLGRTLAKPHQRLA